MQLLLYINFYCKTILKPRKKNKKVQNIDNAKHFIT